MKGRFSGILILAVLVWIGVAARRSDVVAGAGGPEERIVNYHAVVTPNENHVVGKIPLGKRLLIKEVFSPGCLCFSLRSLDILENGTVVASIPVKGVENGHQFDFHLSTGIVINAGTELSVHIVQNQQGDPKSVTVLGVLMSD